MSEPRTWASVHKEWLGDGSLMNGYTKRGLSYATGEMAWNASRAALLAESPDVEGLVKELREVGWYAESQIDDIIDALLSQAARIKALEDRLEIPTQGEFKHLDGIACRDETIRLQDVRIKELEGEVAKLKGHAEGT